MNWRLFLYYYINLPTQFGDEPGQCIHLRLWLATTCTYRNRFDEVIFILECNRTFFFLDDAILVEVNVVK